MTWFHSFRGDHGFTFYGSQPSPDSLDKPLVAVVYVCVLLSGATLIATLGIRGREKWSHAIRASYAVAIASSILLCLMSHNWMEGTIKVKAPFVYRSNMHFSGSLTVQIGLKSANITLDGTYMSPTGGRDVYYVESLPWTKYGHERNSYQHQLQRGLPAPVLRVMDFLTYEHGDLQWGKSYHMAGQYAWALLWTSFVFWLLANLLLFSVVVYGAYMFFLSGVALLMACVAFSQTLNPQPLHMTFGPDVLQLEYGWSFWLAIVAGCLTTILGVLLIVTDHFLHSKVAEFFHLEKMVEEEEYAKDDMSIQMNKARFYSDARGSQASSIHGGPDSRRGSIFLEPSRQTKWTPSPFGAPFRGNNPFGSQGIANGNGNGNGLDPNAKEMTRYDVNSPFRLDNRSKSESFISGHGGTGNNGGKPPHHRNMFHSRMSVGNDRKPSLATLKEHRENHVNEQKFANSSQISLSCSNTTTATSGGGEHSSASDSSSFRAPSPSSPSVVTRSLNDVNPNRSSQQQQQQQQRRQSQSGSFLDQAAQNIRQRSSLSGIFENGGRFPSSSNLNSNSNDRFLRQTSDPLNKSYGNTSSNEAVVEVVVENRPHHHNPRHQLLRRQPHYHRGDGDDNDNDDENVEDQDEEVEMEDERVSPQGGAGEEETTTMRSQQNDRGITMTMTEHGDNFQLYKKKQRNSDDFSSSNAGDDNNSYCYYNDRLGGSSNRSSGGSVCSSSNNPGDEGVVFALSYSRSNSRQASEGEEGEGREEMTSFGGIMGKDNMTEVADVTSVAANDLDKNRKIRRALTADNDRQVSISIGEI